MVPVVLTIGALDPTGVDGVLADIRTLAALGVHGAAAVAQIGVPGAADAASPIPRTAAGGSAIARHRGSGPTTDRPPDGGSERGSTALAPPMDPETIAAQIACVLGATRIAAVKLGALSSPATVRAVTATLAGCAAPIIADPSFAGRDGALPDPALVAAWCQLVLPRAEVVTPNMAEAALLTGTPRATTLGGMRRQGEALVALGCRHAVVSGGHGQSAHSIDILVSHDTPPLEMRTERLARDGVRGLSATLASAIAAHVAHGLPTAQAINHARLFVATALGAADFHSAGNGAGDGPLMAHQLHRLWRPRATDAGA